MDSATENNRHKLLMVRVKTGGKSTRCRLVIVCRGKPYLEQDKIGMYGVRSGLNMRVCRTDRWLPIVYAIQNPAY
jgi:hypothetical protein